MQTLAGPMAIPVVANTSTMRPQQVSQRPFLAPTAQFVVRKRQLKAARKATHVSVRAASSSAETSLGDNFVPVMQPEDLPKGVRKEVRVQGKSVLVFWYRNQIYAIEARSPAEGAYSEGFIRSKFTQDYCIECPTTGSLFSLKDGSIVEWYPNNPVLRLLTPSSTCRPLEIYPVKLTQDAISVDVSGGAEKAGAAPTKGGSDTSLENNNVYGLEPKVYVEGSISKEAEGTSMVAQVATAGVSVLAIGAVGAVAVAVFKYISQ